METLLDVCSTVFPSLKRKSAVAQLDLAEFNADGGELQYGFETSALPSTERDLIKEAFLTDTNLPWIIRENGTRRHRILTWYMLECLLRMSKQYGHVLTCRDTRGAFLGHVGIIPPYRNKKFYHIHFMRSILTLGNPPARDMGPDVYARFNRYIEVMAKTRENVMGNTPHWYIVAVAVSPKQQRRGIGAGMMRRALAVCKDYPIYLMCRDGNVEFYSKLGFALRERLLIGDGEYINSMTYNESVEK